MLLRTPVLLVCWLVAVSPAWCSDDLPRQIVSAHNAFRSEARVPPVVWDEGLAREAAGWAEQLGRSGRLQHSPFLRAQGENLWMGTAGSVGVADMVGSWGAERRHYRGGVFPDVSRTGQFQAVAHYTQIVWRDTRRVGCGLARSGGWDVLVCRYSRPGNVMGQLVY